MVSEELEAENKRLKSMIADVIYDTGDDPEIMAASRAEWAHRALEAEAKVVDVTEEFDAIVKHDRHRIEELVSMVVGRDNLIKELFRLLDITEQTDDGRYFKPNKISSCRALDAEKLEQVLKELKNVLEDRG